MSFAQGGDNIEKDEQRKEEGERKEKPTSEKEEIDSTPETGTRDFHRELEQNNSENEIINVESDKLEEDALYDSERIKQVLRDDSEAWPDFRMKLLCPETEDEKFRHKLGEEFERLDEEQREKFVERARETLESEEYVEELIAEIPGFHVQGHDEL